MYESVFEVGIAAIAEIVVAAVNDFAVVAETAVATVIDLMKVALTAAAAFAVVLVAATVFATKIVDSVVGDLFAVYSSCCIRSTIFRILPFVTIGRDLLVLMLHIF